MTFFLGACAMTTKFLDNKIRSRPGKPNQRKVQNEKFMNFAHFCEFWWFSLGKQARFTLNFCSGMSLRKVHEPTFLWFGLPGPLLIKFALLKFYCRGVSHKKQRFGRFSSLSPRPPPQKAKILFLLSSRRLWHSQQHWEYSRFFGLLECSELRRADTQTLTRSRF